MFKFKVIELTKNNILLYLNDLEKLIKPSTEKEDNYEDLKKLRTQIFSNVEDKDNSIIVAIDEKNNVLAASIIEQGQSLVEKNDTIRYLTYGDKYQKYLKQTYSADYEYEKDMLDAYKLKIQAFRYAKDIILKEHPEFNGNIMAFFYHDLENRSSSILRKKLREYMFSYVKTQSKENPKLMENYEKFYWITAEHIAKQMKKSKYKSKYIEIEEYEKLMKVEKYEYKRMIQKMQYIVYDKSGKNLIDYYNMNSSNTLSINTFIANLGVNGNSISPILVFEGLKKHICKFFKNKNNKEIYIINNDKEDNNSISNFFELKDKICIKRIYGTSKEIDVTKIGREDYAKYLIDKQNKLVLSYSYDPYKKEIATKRTIKKKSHIKNNNIQINHSSENVMPTKKTYIGPNLKKIIEENILYSQIDSLNRMRQKYGMIFNKSEIDFEI